MSNPSDGIHSRIAFIGGGNMARSLIGGLLGRGAKTEQLTVAEPMAELRDALARDFSVAAQSDNLTAAQDAEVWVLAVKPQVLRVVCEGLAALAQAKRPVVVSIAAGITTVQLDRWLGGGQAVVRAMPNTPALLGAGATGLFANEAVTPSQHRAAEALMQAVGMTAWIPEEASMDAVTAVSGSGPAYIFLLAEAMQAAGEAQGLTPDTARQLALQTVFGAARMLVEAGEPAAVLRQRVTSPGGTTQAALDVFEAGGFRALVAGAIRAASERGRSLSAAND